VLGVAVYQIGYTGTWWCGGNYRPGYVHAGTEAGALIRALSDGRRLALTRMTEEAAALGADGVVGVELELRPFPDVPTAVEFHAIGTAIRADGDVRPTTPFLSILSGQDFAKLLRAGWVPTGIATGISVVARHDDLATVLQAGSTWNTEVAGFTQLVQGARHNARTALADDVRRLGGEGVVIRDTTLSTSMQACSGVGSGGGQHDHLAEAVVTGTAITRFRRSDPDNTPPTLPILRLG
jgi:uncharacterized protein YbjQ (UPF0145 family)